MAQFEYPLTWPANFPRTANRKADSFAMKGDRGGMQSLTTHQAYMRVFKEAAAFTRPKQVWRIFPDTLVVSSNLRVRRSDHMPESTQKAPLDPGVAVYFELDKQPYCLPCDKWDSVAGNLAAVAAHLNAIRGIERWGVGDLRAQFAGYQALPDPDRIIWRDVFGYDKHAPPPSAQELANQFKLLRSKQHPDKGGNAQEFDRVMKAYELACKELGYGN